MAGAADAPRTVTVLRAYKYALDPRPTQVEQLVRFAGAARWAFNHALAAKITVHEQWRTQVDQLIHTGIDEATARRQVKIAIPTRPSIQKAWSSTRGDSRRGLNGACPWWHEVSSRCFLAAFADADTAWANWLSSVTGRRPGRRVGYPRFKKKGRARDSFRIHHDVTQPTIRLPTHRRLLVPRLGEIRLHGGARVLARHLNDGTAVIQSVTISRTGHRWYASILCKITMPARGPSRRQREAGTVGVDLGVRSLAALSTGEHVPNPRHLDQATRRLVKAQRALSRTQPGSRRRAKARARVARTHHDVGTRRAGALHQLTKRLAIGWAVVAVEDLNVVAMTTSAHGTTDQPGRMVAQKAGLNRRILDAGFGEIRRQLSYKTTWYGSILTVIDRWAPTSKTCSACGGRNPNLPLTERTFRCTRCGLIIDRDTNAAMNIRTLAATFEVAVVPGSGETLNARRGEGHSRRCPKSQTREDQATTVVVRPPQRSDPLASHSTTTKPAA